MSDLLYAASGSTFNIRGDNPNGIGTLILALGQNGTFNIAGTSEISAIISATNFGFTKTGTGTLMLSAANTFNGNAIVNSGTLALNSNNALQNSTLDTGASGAQVVTLTVAGINTYNFGGLAGGDALSLGANSLSVGSNNASTTFSGSLQSTGGGLTKVGTGTLTLSGANTYNGTTTINAGNITISSGSAIADTATVTLANTAGVGFNVNSSETIGSLQGAGSAGGTVTIASGQTLNVAEAGSQTFAGFLQGSGNLVKSGVGMLTLSGSNTNSGALAVTAGTLALSGANALSSGIFSLNATSSTISLADGASRTLTISNGNLSLDNATLLFDIGATSDRLTLTSGTASLLGTNTISLVDIGSFSYSSPITLLSAAGGLGGGTWSLNTASAPTGYTFSLNATDSALLLVAVQNSAYYYWKGANGSTWGTVNNWTSDSAGNTPIADALGVTADVVFAASEASNLSNTLGADYTINTLTVSASGVNIAGANTLTANASSSSAFNISASSGTIAISANLAGVSAGLTKSGAGTLMLSGSNSFGGGVTMSAGTLNLNSATAPGTGTLTIGGGILDNTSGSSVTLSTNNTQSWNGDFSFQGTNNLNLGTGAVTLGASRTVTVAAGNLTVGGAIAGAGFGLTKSGAGTLALAGANTYSGGTTLNAGTLVLNNSGSGGTSSAIGTGTLTIGSGTLDNTSGSSVTLSTNNAQAWNGDFSFTGTNDLNLGTGTVTLGASRTVTVAAGNLTVGGAIAGAGFGLTKSGAGTLVLGGVNTYTGATTINSGTLRTSAANVIGSSSAVIIASGATFQIGGSNTVASLSGAGNIILGNNTLTFGDSSNQTFSGSISGNGALVKNGTGAVTLSGNNTYAGGTVISAGTIRLGHDNSLGSGNLSTSGSVTIASSDATARTITSNYTSITGSGVTITFGETSGGTGNLTFAGTGNLSLGSGTRTMNVLNTTIFNGLVTGAGGLTKSGAGMLVLSANNTYTGATTINSGTLQIGNGGTTGSIASTSGVTNNGIMAFNRSNTLTAAYAIGGTGAVIQNGTGSLTLSGSNSYSGGTTLNNGTLVLGHTSAAGSGNITQTSVSSLLSIATTGTLSNAMSVYNVAATENTMLSGPITVNNTTFDVETGDTLTISGNVSGAGGITKNGQGIFVLCGNNSYDGATTVNTGILNANSVNALGLNNTVTVNGGSLLVSADGALSGKEITLASSSTIGLIFSGNYNGSIGRLTLSTNSIVDLGEGNSVVARFAEIAFLNNSTLKIYNWSGTTLWNGGDGNNTDRIYFNRNLSDTELEKISFYRDFGNDFLGNGYQIMNGNFANEVIPVPEPETWATGLILLMGGLFCLCRRQRIIKP